MYNLRENLWFRTEPKANFLVMSARVLLHCTTVSSALFTQCVRTYRSMRFGMQPITVFINYGVTECVPDHNTTLLLRQVQRQTVV